MVNSGYGVVVYAQSFDFQKRKEENKKESALCPAGNHILRISGAALCYPCSQEDSRVNTTYGLYAPVDVAHWFVVCYNQRQGSRAGSITS